MLTKAAFIYVIYLNMLCINIVYYLNIYIICNYINIIYPCNTKQNFQQQIWCWRKLLNTGLYYLIPYENSIHLK